MVQAVWRKRNTFDVLSDNNERCHAVGTSGYYLITNKLVHIFSERFRQKCFANIFVTVT